VEADEKKFPVSQILGSRFKSMVLIRLHKWRWLLGYASWRFDLHPFVVLCCKCSVSRAF